MSAKLVLGDAALSRLENLGSGASLDATQPCSGRELGHACRVKHKGLPFGWALNDTRLEFHTRVGSSWRFCMFFSLQPKPELGS